MLSRIFLTRRRMAFYQPTKTELPENRITGKITGKNENQRYIALPQLIREQDRPVRIS
jgi:hypothetical protein